MLKRFLMKKMMAKQLQGVPEEEQEKLFTMIEKNPELFQKIADETKRRMDDGKDQMTATMEVMQKYQSELKELM